MDNLLFTLLILALLYYFLIYLPSQRKPKEPIIIKPFTASQGTQTETIIATKPDNPELNQALTTLLHNLKNLNQTI